MLLSPVVKTNDVVSIKLTSGEEIIAKLVSIESDSFLVHSPVSCMPQAMPSDPSNPMSRPQMVLSLAPFMLTVDPSANVSIMKTAVASITKSNDDVNKSYIKSTTGLDIPTSGLIHGLTGGRL